MERRVVLPAARRHVLAGAVASVGYVALVGIRGAHQVGLAGLLLATLALALAWTSARVRDRPLAWACWGAAMVAASIDVSPATLVPAMVGAIATSAAAVVGLARIASLGGIVRGRERSSRVGLLLVGSIWLPAGIAVMSSLVMQRELPYSSGAMVVAAAGLSTLAVAGYGAAASLERQLELGVAERLSAFLLLAATLAVLGILAGVAGIVDGVPAACAVTALVGMAACVTAQMGEPVALWRGVRRGTALAGLAVALGATFAFLVVDQRALARELAFALALVGLVIGAELPRIARKVRGTTGRRLAASALAAQALRGREADLGIAHALRALGGAAPPPLAATKAQAAELWSLDPVRVLRVDAAGYPSETPSELPAELLVVALGEPQSTLRAEALAAVEIRRPDLRSLSQWMRDAKMATATLITRGGDIEGVLFLPTYEGIPSLTLEEAYALRDLADALAPLCHARAKLARSMVRENEARTEAGDATTRAERLEHHLARAAAHNALAAARLARPAAVGIYAARSRAAYEALEKLTKAQAPIAIVAPSGVDPVPFLARAHLAGARVRAPLVLVDATSTREHDLARWRDPASSPLELADGGVLVLLDAAALPLDVQRLIGQSLAERRVPWERADALDIVLAITTIELPRDLADQNRLDPLLASRLGAAIDEPVHLPGIADRPEDIRALVTDRLAREGLRVLGAPVGIDDAAFALLVDHPFEGEEAELTAIVHRLVARVARSGARDVDGSAAGGTSRARDVVREADVRAVLEPWATPTSLSRERRA